MKTRQFLSPKSQAGQAIVLVAFMIIVLFGAVGLAVDGGIAYYYNSAAERAAASAALAGVIFMPNQLAPCCGGNDATDRAYQATQRNGFPNGGPNNVTVTVGTYTDPISGLVQPESLQVRVTRDVPTFFMNLFGIPKITVSRTAVAQYLKPLKLGEPCLFPPGDCHTGSTVSQLGRGGFYVLRTEGWSTDRGQGDAYTPNNVGCAGPECPSNDVHAISGSQGTDVADASFPAPGGYNYILTVPAGYTAQIQVYNAAFAPDTNVSGPNYCENKLNPNPALASGDCSQGADPATGCGTGPNIGCAWHMHEADTAPYGTASLYSAMQYTILNSPSAFIRNSDTILSQMIVKPVDASSWQANAPNGTDTGGNGPYYVDPSNNKKITQTFGSAAQCAPRPAGCPTNMTAYHSWMNVGGYNPNNSCSPTPLCPGGYEAESAIISYNAARGPIGALGAGTYRLRIDTLNFDGTIPPGGSQAHKGMAVRVMNGAGTGVCGTAATPCTLSALDDLSFYTPIQSPAGGFFRMPIFAVPAIYAGLTISIDVFDAGDASGATGSIYLGLVDPTTCNLFQEPAGGQTATVVDLGGQRIPPLAPYPLPPASGLGGTFGPGVPVEQIVNDGTTVWGDNRWYRYNVPIPNTYAPVAGGTACDPTGQGYWLLQYRTSNNVTANDTITITVNLRGNPAHILKS
jgi:hypothetical protein